MQQYGISPKTLQENHDLASFFKILTTSTDEDDKVVNLVASFPQVMTHTPESIPEFPFFPMNNSNSCSNYQVYVSTVHAYSYPVTAFQWHPEVLSSWISINDLTQRTNPFYFYFKILTIAICRLSEEYQSKKNE